MEMHIYDALGYIDRGLGFENKQLLNYIVWTSSEDNHSLITQHITRQEPINDRKVECKWIMIALQEPIEKVSLEYRFDKKPLTKLQVYFLKNAREVQEYKEINENQGYSFVYTRLTDWSSYKKKRNKGKQTPKNFT
jgi:hypothetical protein